ncbi:MAG: ABC transporter permease [Anaerolineae bacterium]|nr:ABC transporter permease [Anaerolineae bacterium]
MAERVQVSTNVVQLKATPADKPQLGDSLWRRALRHLRRDKLTLAAMAVIATITLLALFAPVITGSILRVDPESTNPAQRLLPPGSPGHILGTDDLGRDYLARLLYGGRISLAIGFSGAIITLAIGLTLGMLTGYYGGRVDDFMNWLITTLDSIPSLYLLILVSTMLRPGPEALVLVLALTGWTGGTRLIRGQTISLRHLDYIVSAQAIGASPWQIMFTHILPNLLSVTLIALAGGVAGLILSESALSFLKLGVQPPTPTWGNMLTNAQLFFSRGPHLAIISGLLIFVTVLCLYIIGDGLRDAFDPQTSS